MSRVTQYKTKQKDELLSFLQSVPHTRVTVSEIVHHFSACGIVIGTATIYRRLEQMVQKGNVKKYFVDGISGACFEYVGECPQQGTLCFYLKCESCGKLVHFHCEELEHLQRHLLLKHGFSIDSSKTVLYGMCSECTNQSAK